MNKQIIIIGAGASGIAAATKLVSNGFRNVIILEAENRIGGRIQTVPFAANVVDMGAQWCQGEKGNVVYELANGTNLLETSVSVFGFQNFIRSDGQQIASEKASKLLELGMSIYRNDKYKAEKSTYKGSLGNFFAEKYREELKKDKFRDIDDVLAYEVFEMLQRLICSEDGADSWYETSSQNRFEWSEGNELLSWKDKGFVTVLDLLQNKTSLEKPQLDILPLTQFNKTVKKIVYNQSTGVIRVECKDATSYQADHVICTVSLGVLKKCHLRMFEPALPLTKRMAIDGLSYGTVDKMYLEFEEPFWSQDWGGFSILWKSEDLSEIRNDPINGQWMEGLVGVYNVNTLQPNVLCFWITGKEARFVEQLSDARMKASLERVLRMFVKQWTVPEAKAMIRSKWHSNPNFRGSYSCFTLKSKALDASAEQLTEPVCGANGRPLIQFAGEATSVNHYACVHGAIESGWREANRIVDLYK